MAHRGPIAIIHRWEMGIAGITACSCSCDAAIPVLVPALPAADGN